MKIGASTDIWQFKKYANMVDKSGLSVGVRF